MLVCLFHFLKAAGNSCITCEVNNQQCKKLVLDSSHSISLYDLCCLRAGGWYNFVHNAFVKGPTFRLIPKILRSPYMFLIILWQTVSLL
jgi:hypothetical protein